MYATCYSGQSVLLLSHTRLWDLCQLPSVEMTSVITVDWKQNTSFCMCKTCGADTVLTTLLPKPPIQTWQAALVLLLTMVRLYAAVIVIPALSWVSGVHECDVSGGWLWEESRCSVVLKMAMFPSCSAASVSAQYTALAFTLTWLKWMAGENEKLSLPCYLALYL